MSGSGGGRDDDQSPRVTGGPGRGGGGPGGNDPCAIIQQAPLNSPRPDVVGTLSAGDVLTVELNSSGTRPILEVHTAAGAVAGSLTHTGHVQIIACIEAGHSYIAEVTGRSGGAVNLQISPA